MARTLRKLRGASEALGIDLEAIATSEIRDQLEAGYAVSASLQYADLPDYLKVQGGDFGHGVCLYGYKASDDLVGYFILVAAQRPPKAPGRVGRT